MARRRTLRANPLRGAPWLVLLLLLPVASATAPAQVEGSLLVPDGARLAGHAWMDATRAILDLSPIGAQKGALLAWTRAEVTQVEKSRVAASALDAWRVRDADPVNDTFSLGAGSLDGLACEARCVVALFTEGVEGATIGFDAPLDASISWLDAQREFRVGPANQSESITRVAYEGWTSWSVDAPRLGPRVGLVLWNASGVLRADGSARPFHAGIERAPMAPLLGDAVENVTSRYYVLALEGPRFVARTPNATLFAGEPDVGLEGALDAPRAQGDLKVDGRVVEATGSAVHAEGRFLLRPSASFRLLPGVDARDPLSKGTPSVALQGAAAKLVVGGEVVARDPALPQAAKGALAFLALLALLWPFYTRLSPARLLANPNRARLHAIVRGSPGACAADLVRETGLARVVVDHHLRALVTHGFLVARRGAGRISYYPPTQAPDPWAQARADALRDPTRFRIADELFRAPGLRQKELAHRVQVRQRLVSHHLRRLEDAGLVRAEGSMPRRYYPTRTLGPDRRKL